jgi:hypothetical protein
VPLRRLLVPARLEPRPRSQVGVRIHGCDPSLKHHSTRADNGEQVAVPRWNGGVGGREPWGWWFCTNSERCDSRRKISHCAYSGAPPFVAGPLRDLLFVNTRPSSSGWRSDSRNSRCKWEASRRSIGKFPVSPHGPLDPRAPQAETDAVGCPWAVAMLLNHLGNGPGRVAEHHGRGPRYASSRLPSFRLLGRGVFRPLSTARS